jgi:hypothetical protein
VPAWTVCTAAKLGFIYENPKNVAVRDPSFACAVLGFRGWHYVEFHSSEHVNVSAALPNFRHTMKQPLAMALQTCYVA